MVKTLTVRLTEDLHVAARKLAGRGSLNAFVREAVAEKVGRAELGIESTASRAEMRTEMALLERRIARLERIINNSLGWIEDTMDEP